MKKATETKAKATETKAKATETKATETKATETAWKYDVLTMDIADKNFLPQSVANLTKKNTQLLSTVRLWYRQQKGVTGATIGLNALLCRFAIAQGYKSAYTDRVDAQTLKLCGTAKKAEYFSIGDIATVCGIVDATAGANKIIITRKSDGTTQLKLVTDLPSNVKKAVYKPAKETVYTISEFTKSLESLIAKAKKLDKEAVKNALLACI